MKESKLIEMQNKVKAMTNVIQQLLNEISYLKDLSVGTLETLKLMPGYDQAIKDLQSNMEKQMKERKKAEQNGTIEQDTK
jgi:hypothetical protein|tara:strand:- start:25657 stop:25896 length:240 start_codon:yes stop_codon:yes gene_type:complete